MAYLLKMVIFHGYVSHNQMVIEVINQRVTRWCLNPGPGGLGATLMSDLLCWVSLEIHQLMGKKTAGDGGEEISAGETK